MIFLAGKSDASPDTERAEATARGRLRLALVAGWLTVEIAGCASPGIPRPPSLNLPATVTDLTATRIADRVELQWTAPTRTTDGLDLTGPTKVEICRDLAAAAAQCTVVLSAPGNAGPSSATDHLPASLTGSGDPRPILAYRVRVLNPSRRSAPPSPPALIPGGPGVLSVEGFRAVQQKAGVLLEWQTLTPESGSTRQLGNVEAIRILQSPPAKPANNTSRQSFARPSREPKTAEVRLRPGDAGSLSAEISTRQLDGMVDQGTLQNETYLYRLQRVLAIPVAGKTIEILSEPTPPVTIVTRDIFPPEPPKGLASVPGTIGPSAGATTPRSTIDLSWEPNPEAGIAGYMVYRIDLAAPAQKPVRLTEAAIPEPAYRDTAVLAGHRYEYRVIAVGRNGYESAASGAVQDSPEGH